ncbi:hypothetical protein [Lentzea atacamensis]|uniref:hypothetical protein n=1 Tax=Lentzea atacamensis TaxID=531938 RepID=UPI0011B55D3C|nr:hypothetical protein [Lentzea atacamensis]
MQADVAAVHRDVAIGLGAVESGVGVGEIAVDDEPVSADARAVEGDRVLGLAGRFCGVVAGRAAGPVRFGVGDHGLVGEGERGAEELNVLGSLSTSVHDMRWPLFCAAAP